MTRDEFRHLVAEALETIPKRFRDAMQNIAIVIEDEPTLEQLADVEVEPPETLLGLYQGTPLTERGEWWAAGSLPDRILVFRHPTLAVCDTREDVVEEVAVTVVHEIAHHFGIDDAALHELGWG